MYLNIKTVNSFYAYIGLKMYINMKKSSEMKEQFLDTLHVLQSLFATVYGLVHCFGLTWYLST